MCNILYFNFQNVFLADPASVENFIDVCSVVVKPPNPSKLL